MKGPTIFEYVLLIVVSLVFAMAGLYMLANFSRLLRSKIKNELLRKNIVAWMIIFCMSVAMVPMSGGFFYLLEKHGWGWAIGGQFIFSPFWTFVIFNLMGEVADSRQLKK